MVTKRGEKASRQTTGPMAIASVLCDRAGCGWHRTAIIGAKRKRLIGVRIPSSGSKWAEYDDDDSFIEETARADHPHGSGGLRPALDVFRVKLY